jgi:hypothetical protein
VHRAASRVDRAHFTVTGVKHIALVVVLAAEACGLPARPVHSGDDPSHSRLAGPAASSVNHAKPLHEMPADEYGKLWAEALRKAHVHAGPMVRNPRLANGELESAVLRTLEQQRKFTVARQSISGRSGDSAKLSGSDPDHPTCTNAEIRSVNGVPKGPIFTPRDPDNHYTIEGCSLGMEQGRVQLRLDSETAGEVPKLLDLHLERSSSWSETRIDAYVDSNTTGLRDYSGKATLQVVTAKKQILELPGCSFVALRSEPQLLTVIPSSWVRLQPTLASARPLRKLEYVSPALPAGDVPDAAVGTSALVMRSDVQRFSSGSDIFDFSHLLNGWVVEKVEPLTYTVSCPGIRMGDDYSGQWNLQWNKTSITYGWREEYCASFVPPYFGFNMSASPYALKVWVRGPVGTPFLPPNAH